MRKKAFDESLGGMTSEQLGHGMRVARTRARMTARYVGECLGVGWQTVLRWERGDTPVLAVVMFAMEGLYQTGIDEMAADGRSMGGPDGR